MLVFDANATLQSENAHLKSQIYALTMEIRNLRRTVQTQEIEKANLSARVLAQDNTIRNQQRDIQVLTDRAQILSQQINGLLIDKSSAHHALETLSLYHKSLHEELQLTDSDRFKLQNDQEQLLREAHYISAFCDELNEITSIAFRVPSAE